MLSIPLPTLDIPNIGDCSGLSFIHRILDENGQPFNGSSIDFNDSVNPTEIEFYAEDASLVGISQLVKYQVEVATQLHTYETEFNLSLGGCDFSGFMLEFGIQDQVVYIGEAFQFIETPLVNAGNSTCQVTYVYSVDGNLPLSQESNFGFEVSSENFSP